MDFAFSEEQEELRRTVRSFLEDTSPETEVRRLMDTPAGFDPAVWRRMGAELGLQGLAIPEEYGGAGCGMVEVGLVLEEMGRALLCAPYFASAVLATTVLTRCTDEPLRKRLLPALASGDVAGTLALTEDSGRWDREGVTTTARPHSAHSHAARWLLSGHKNFVLDGASADFILTVALAPDDVGIFMVEADATGLTRTPLPTLDQTRRQARLEYRDVPATRIQLPLDGWQFISSVLDRAAVALAAEQVGVAAKSLDTAVEYAKTRQQFGRPIGSFQAIKHLLADVLLEVESARAAAHFAMLAADDDEDQLPAAANLAKAYCSDACLKAAQENVQVHGGIGFTWEHSAHLYLKRAKTSQLLLGDPAYHRELLARRIGL